MSGAEEVVEMSKYERTVDTRGLSEVGMSVFGLSGGAGCSGLRVRIEVSILRR